MASFAKALAMSRESESLHIGLGDVQLLRIASKGVDHHERRVGGDVVPLFQLGVHLDVHFAQIQRLLQLGQKLGGAHIRLTVINAYVRVLGVKQNRRVPTPLQNISMISYVVSRISSILSSST